MTYATSSRAYGYAHTDESTWSDDEFVVPDDDSDASIDDSVYDSSTEKAGPQLLGRRGVNLNREALKEIWDRPVIKNLTKKVEEGHTLPVYERDELVERIVRLIAGAKGGTRPLLLGPRGVGKKAVVRALANRLLDDDCLPSLKGYRVVMINGISLLSQATGVGKSEQRDSFRKIQNLMEEQIRQTDGKTIFYFRDVDQMFRHEEVQDFLTSHFDGPLHCIASVASTPEDEDTRALFAKLKPYHFELCQVPELSGRSVRQIIQDKLTRPSYHAGPKLSESALDSLVETVPRYLHNGPEPVQSLRIAVEAQNVALQRARSSTAASSQSSASTVTSDDVLKVLSEKTGIPASRLASSDLEFVNFVRRHLKDHIIGQDGAIEEVVNCIESDILGLSRPNKPRAALLFMGPTGVGKTYLSELMAQLLFNDSQAYLRYDMSEYSEDYTVSQLLGAPAGYVGHESGGVLTEAMRSRSQGVILLDEFEKAHDIVRKTFLGALDRGVMTDRRGNRIDCSGWVFLFTSNIAATKLFNDPNLTDEVRDELKSTFSPEFCGRLSGIIPFQPLLEADYPAVIESHLKRLQKEWSNRFKLSWTKTAITQLAKLDMDRSLGHRQLCLQVTRLVDAAIKDTTRKENKAPRGQDVRLTSFRGSLVARIESPKRPRKR